MFLTFPELQECIKKAEESRACSDELGILNSLTSIQEFFDHPKCPFWLYWYARNIINGRWLEAEPFINKNVEYSYWYARWVIKGRWVEAETVIRTYPDWAYRYARYVIKGRWPEVEYIISKNDITTAVRYARDVVPKSYKFI